MELTHLQFNTYVLNDPEATIDFMNEYDVDVASLQEIAYPIGEESPLKHLAEQDDYEYAESVLYTHEAKDLTVAVALLSRFPVIDTVTLYYNSDDFYPKELTSESFQAKIINDSQAEHFPGSRSLPHAMKSRAILSGVLDVDGKKIRVVTTHFTLSDSCTETLQQFKMAQMLTSFIDHAKDLPTILGADFNLRSQSYSVSLVESVLQCHTKDFQNTLSPTHPALQDSFPEGLATDHVFSKNMNHHGTEVVEVVFSDHQALISKFELS